MMSNLTPAIVITIISTATTYAQLPAFPGADGAAAHATGGRGGIVYHVTKLDRNYSDNTEGTLRYGLNDNNFSGRPRTIVFDIGGTFWLGRYGAERNHNNGWDTQSRVNLGNNLTIAGQTAPGPVIIMGGVVKAGSSNVILRNVTIAPGYGMRSFEQPDAIPPQLPKPGDFPDSYVYDALDISGSGIMISHVTAVYATDETISANETARDVTIQYCIISQGQNYPQADAEAVGVYTGHALGSLLQAGSNARISVLHNLYAHQKGRLPRVGSENGTGAINDFRNNVFYNWFGTAGTGAQGQPSFNNFINNFYLAGPGGDDASGTRIVWANGGTGIFDGKGAAWTRAYVAGNLKDTNKDADPNDAASADAGFAKIAPASAPYDVSIGVTLSARDAFANVLHYAGARWWQRDYDTAGERLTHETETCSGKIMAWADDPFNSDPNEGVEWRSLLALRADVKSGAAPFNRPVNWDTDRDGMPNDWEQEHGLPVDVANNNGDFDNDGYTDLEEYLNDAAAWPAPGEIIFVGVNNRYAEISNWRVNGVEIGVSGRNAVATSSPWQPSRYDTAVISHGDVVVDAVGQHAGVLKIGADAALTIASGWLKVADRVIIGADANAAATLNLRSGTLAAGALGKEPGGTFSFTGGRLCAGEVAFHLVNDGGTIAPGSGSTHVSSDLTLNSGAVQIDVHAAGEFSTIIVDGTATLAGQLTVELGSFVPSPTDVFEVVRAASRKGTFSNASAELDTGAGTFDVTYTDASVVLSNFRAE